MRLLSKSKRPGMMTEGGLRMKTIFGSHISSGFVLLIRIAFTRISTGCTGLLTCRRTVQGRQSYHGARELIASNHSMF
jgi:hypothetical protein